MSHQTGIRSNDELRQFIAKAKQNSSNVRLFKITINDSTEELVLDCFREVDGDWKHDYGKYLTGNSLVDPKQPCFIFFRLDERDHTPAAHYLWLFITWSPDFASVKHKMLYAATKSTLKMEFGSGDHIKDELFCTHKDEVTLDGYLKHLKAQLAPKPLTVREEELEAIRQSEHHARINVDSKQKTLQGVMFPIDESAQRNLERFQHKAVNYMQLYIDIQNEKILSASVKEHIHPNDIQTETPADKGRFHLFRYIHSLNDEHFENIVFIYTMPGFSSPIKERMLYSSCKSELLAHLKQNLKLDLSKTFETGDMSEITEAYLLDELHPKQLASASKFEKPKGPSARGPRRIIK